MHLSRDPHPTGARAALASRPLPLERTYRACDGRTMLMSSARTSDARSAVRTCVPRVLLRPRVAGPWSLPHMRVRAPRPLETSLRAIPGRNVAEIFFAGGGLCEMTLTDEQQTALVRAVAKHISSRYVRFRSPPAPPRRCGRRGSPSQQRVRRPRGFRDSQNPLT